MYLRIRSQKSGISEMIRKKFSIHQLKTSRPRVQNLEKENRLSWSGKPIPKIDQWNDFGCILRVDTNNNIKILLNNFV